MPTLRTCPCAARAGSLGARRSLANGGRTSKRPSHAPAAAAPAEAEAAVGDGMGANEGAPEVAVRVNGSHMPLTPAIKEYAQAKVGNAIAHFGSLVKGLDVKLTARGHPGGKGPKSQKTEVTVRVKGRAVVRAEQAADDLYESIDKAADKVERALRKHKERVKGKLGGAKHMAPRLAAAEVVTDELVPDIPLAATAEPRLPTEAVRTKYFSCAPITEEEAIERLEQLDHDFYVYQSTDTKRAEVVYRRSTGGYGRIVPMLEG